MSRNIISILLSIIFLLFLVAPTVIVMVDDSVDISFFFTSSGEEEDKGVEKNKDLEVLFSESKMNETDFVLNKTENNTWYFSKNYPKPHLNLISPPPEIHIL